MVLSAFQMPVSVTLSARVGGRGCGPGDCCCFRVSHEVSLQVEGTGGRGQVVLESGLKNARFLHELKDPVIIFFLLCTAKKRKLLTTWQHWLVYVDVQRTQRRTQYVALAFRERSCLR